MTNEDEELVFEEEKDTISEEETSVEDTLFEEQNEEKVDSNEEASDENSSSETADDLERRYMNLYAEYENFRKRTQKEKDDLYAQAIATVTKEFLTVIDNIDRAVDSSSKAESEEAFNKLLEGMNLVSKQSGQVLERIGVKEIVAEVGTEFDPNLHEAVMHVDNPELGTNVVASLFQKGYIYRDKVIRHAVVQVAN